MTEAQALATATATPEENAPNGCIENFKEEDLAIINNWVRQDLFKKVKFLYDPDRDLLVNGNLFTRFKNGCSSKLIGIKVNAGMSGDFKDLYLNNLWMYATKKKKNLIMDGLNARRSCIYSSMQNRFTGMTVDGIGCHPVCLHSHILFCPSPSQPQTCVNIVLNIMLSFLV